MHPGVFLGMKFSQLSRISVSKIFFFVMKTIDLSGVIQINMPFKLNFDIDFLIEICYVGRKTASCCIIVMYYAA